MKARIMHLCQNCIDLMKEAYDLKILSYDSSKGTCDGCKKKNIAGNMVRVSKKNDTESG